MYDNKLRTTQLQMPHAFGLQYWRQLAWPNEGLANVNTKQACCGGHARRRQPIPLTHLP
jgi:hypothetical protein